ncbi:MAG TPA: hypothetical protein VMT67_17020 [Terriglobales bacterium]|nr:hypothetical protein [Terriglobales bacterium]
MGSDECGNPSDPTQRYYCTIPIASNVACSGGGTVGVTGTNSGDLDYSNTGDTTGILTYTPTNCSIPGSKLVMNGNPGLTFTSSMFYFYGGVSSFTVTATGPINYSSNPTGACQANLTIVASFAGDSHHTVVSCTVSGTACGETIGQNCQ